MADTYETLTPDQKRAMTDLDVAVSRLNAALGAARLAGLNLHLVFDWRANIWTTSADLGARRGFVISKPGLNLPDGSDPAGWHQYWCGNDLWDHRREYAAIFRSAELAKRQIEALGLTEWQYSEVRLDG